MKSIVIYYSQSGNTKKIALALQKGITRENGQCDIARLKDIKPEAWLNYDLIGIGSPVWSSTPTTNVIEYIKSLPPAVEGKHTFFYCTHGVLPGQCIIRGVQPLQEKGLTVIGWHDWYGDCPFLPGHAKPWFTEGHPDAIDLAEAESFGAAMVLHSRKIAAGATDIIPTLPSLEASDEFFGEGYALRPPDTKTEGQPGENPRTPSVGALQINAEKCTGCGLCAKACYYDKIDASVTPPVFKNQDCEGCRFCMWICPTGAIKYPVSASNPHFEQMRENMLKSAAIAEAKGRFRRLVREEDMDWDTPWEETLGHPRLKEIP